MVLRKAESVFRAKHKHRVKADVIILGCTLPGIVTAHKLKKRFGDSMDIMVLDLVGTTKRSSKCNVAFQGPQEPEEYDTPEVPSKDSPEYNKTARQLIDNVARYYLAKYANEFEIPLPDAIVAPEQSKCQLNKVFQYLNGKTVDCVTDYHDFDYLNILEKFELNQYQTLLDQNMQLLFQTNDVVTEHERSSLLYFDQTTMEKHICSSLFFTTSREIMRTTVRVVCGASANIVSVLFYLHQCYRTSSARNHLDGDNTRVREKLLGHCRKRIALKLQQSVADITQAVKHIKEIRICPEDKVIVETMKGDVTYVCNLLAMALKPHELRKIRVEEVLLSKEDTKIIDEMIPGIAKKFVVQYEENFWRKQGYSGDILSIRGPIIWAMERPMMSTTGSKERYAALIGYLMVTESDENEDSREAVIEQLVKLFGEEASTPATYRETTIADVYVPRCGAYVALRRLASHDSTKFLEWAALDIFDDGDVAAAIEAGHTAYIHLLSYLRPQAQTYEDLSSSEWPSFLSGNPLPRWLAGINFVSGVRWSLYVGVSLIALRYLKTYMTK